LMDPTLPSSVRHPATRGGVFGSAVCGTRQRWHFNVESMPLFVGRLGFNLREVCSVRLLQAASYCGGCGVRGLTDFFLARGVASISKSWSVALLVVGTKGSRVGGWSLWVPMMLYGCAALGLRLPGLVGVCCLAAGRWSPGALAGGCRWSRCSFLFTGNGLRWLGLGGVAPRVRPRCHVVVVLFFLFELVVGSLVRWYLVGPLCLIVSSRLCRSLYHHLFYFNTKRANA
jgi:hypothetical protein